MLSSHNAIVIRTRLRPVPLIKQSLAAKISGILNEATITPQFPIFNNAFAKFCYLQTHNAFAENIKTADLRIWCIRVDG